MADHDGTAGESLEAIFKRTQRVDIEVIGGFVEKEDVSATSEDLGEVNTVAFATRENADLLLLIRAFEVERSDIGATVHFASTELHYFVAVGDFLVDRLLGIKDVSTLIDIGEIDGGADLERTAIGFFAAGEHAEQCGLTGAVGPDDADDASAGQREGKVLNEKSVAESLRDAFGLDDDIAEALA